MIRKNFCVPSWKRQSMPYILPYFFSEQPEYCCIHASDRWTVFNGCGVQSLSHVVRLNSHTINLLYDIRL